MLKVLEDGKQQVTVNTIGHNPKDITVDVTEEEIKIKSKKGEDSSSFVKDIDLTLQLVLIMMVQKQLLSLIMGYSLSLLIRK